MALCDSSRRRVPLALTQSLGVSGVRRNGFNNENSDPALARLEQSQGDAR